MAKREHQPEDQRPWHPGRFVHDTQNRSESIAELGCHSRLPIDKEVNALDLTTSTIRKMLREAGLCDNPRTKVTKP